jgi:hypothetical protein
VRFEEDQLTAFEKQGPLSLENLENFVAKTSPRLELLSAPDVVVRTKEVYREKSSLNYMLNPAPFLPLFANLAQAPPGLAQIVIGILKEIVSVEKSGLEYFGIAKQYLMAYSAEQLDYSLYLAFWSLFEAVNTASFFDVLIVNYELWILASPDSFLRILHHWNHATFNNCPLMFQRTNYFSKLLKIFYNLFCGLSLDCFSQSHVNKCQSLFLSLLEATGMISFGHHDATFLMYIACKAPNEQFLLVCLHLIQKLAESVRKWAPEITDLLHVFLERDSLDVLVQTILAVHQLSYPACQQQMTTIGIQLKKREQRVEVFDALVPHIKSYPGTIHLLCIIALNLDQAHKETMTKAIEGCEGQLFQDLLADKFWSLWLLLLAAQMADLMNPLMLFLARLMQFSHDRIVELDLFVDIAQLFDSCLDINASTLLLEVFLALYGFSSKAGELLLERSIRVLFWRYTDCFIDSAIFKFYKESPFFQPSAVFYPRGRINDVLAVDETLAQDFSSFRFVHGVNVDKESGQRQHPMLIFCLQMFERVSLESYELFYRLSLYIQDKARLNRTEQLLLIKELNERLGFLQEQFDQTYLPRIHCLLPEIKAFIKIAKHRVCVEFDVVTQKCNSFKSPIHACSEPPSHAAIISYTHRLKRLTIPATKKVMARDLCSGCVPLKKKFADDHSKLFRLPSQLNFPRPLQNTSIVISHTAEFREFGEKTTINVDIGNKSLVLHNSSLIEIVPISEIQMVLLRGDYAVEVFTKCSGSLYLDFDPVDNFHIFDKFLEVDKRLEKNPINLLLRPMTNFEYLMLLNIFSGKSLHGDKPVFPFGTVDDFYSPELPFADVYKNRKLLETQDVMPWAEQTFKEFVPRTKFGSLDALKTFQVRDLLIPEGSRVDAAQFCGGDSVFLLLNSWTIQFVRIGERPQLIGSQTITICGSTSRRPAAALSFATVGSSSISLRLGHLHQLRCSRRSSL